jgi:peptidoglycan/LPS O-acetylase OafA/YrhL
MQRSGHFHNLDAVRGIAAQVVVISHVFMLLDPAGDLTNPVASWPARLAVLIFFCLSGFAIATTVRREYIRSGEFNCVDYAIRRFARIYPPYLFAILAAAVIVVLRLDGVTFSALKHVDMPFDVSMAAWLRAFTFTFSQPANDALPATNVAIWSLRLELVLYAIAACAALGVAGKIRLTRIVSSVLTIILLLALIRGFALGLTAAMLFAFGGLAALLHHRLPVRPLFGFVCVACAALLPLFFPLFLLDTPAGLFYQGVIGLPIGLWLIALARAPDMGGRTGRALIATGAWSYTLYILHAPTLVMLRALLDPTIGDVTTTPGCWASISCGSFFICNLIAYGVARLVERPALFAEWIERLLRVGRRRPAAAAE